MWRRCYVQHFATDDCRGVTCCGSRAVNRPRFGLLCTFQWWDLISTTTSEWPTLVLATAVQINSTVIESNSAFISYPITHITAIWKGVYKTAPLSIRLFKPPKLRSTSSSSHARSLERLHPPRSSKRAAVHGE